MALRSIVVVPHEALTKKAKEIKDIDERIRKLAADMAETMYKARALAWPQTRSENWYVSSLWTLCIRTLNPSEKKKNPLVLINPTITLCEGECVKEEGCLSVPEFGLEIKRPNALGPRDRRGRETDQDRSRRYLGSCTST